MDKNTTKYSDPEIEKHKFHQHKSCYHNLDIHKVAVSQKVSFRKIFHFKDSIGYQDAKKIRPLCMFLPKMSSYRRDFDENK